MDICFVSDCTYKLCIRLIIYFLCALFTFCLFISISNLTMEQMVEMFVLRYIAEDYIYNILFRYIFSMLRKYIYNSYLTKYLRFTVDIP